ncbi:LysR family transcriptional regulator [Janthinobacterium sp.]|uniref:LysR family transcriptional regulator n=1 Tax=Janthinobacterium sp. TaxID=1871054 RepID=UPI0025880338|nr:LysR family transcriptional regulator [Janthinobacterium sp.]MCX7291869.1 LysR family transcriptional regulator [Janthinobacterium sp.]
MDKLKCMETLVRVVEAGNFTLAGNKLGITTAMVGRQIRQLEELLGTRLLKRDTRKQNLTEAGLHFYRSAKDILDHLDRAQEMAQDVNREPRGRLRIATPISMGSAILAPLIVQYQQRFPQVEIELVLANAMVDLIEEGIDLAVRVGHLPDSGLIARPLRAFQNRICASPTYLARSGTPVQWSDLKMHQCLVHQAWHPEWVAQDGSLLAWPVQQAFSANDGYALRAAALAGAGLLLQPEVMLAEAIAKGELVVVLDRFAPPPVPVHLLYLQDPYPRRRLVSLVDFLVAQLG